MPVSASASAKACDEADANAAAVQARVATSAACAIITPASSTHSGGATASAVLADIADIAAGFGRPLFDKAVSEMTESASENAPASEFYIRLALADKPGSMAKATQILAENGVSIEEVVQRSSEAGDSYLPVVFITHRIENQLLRSALIALEQQTEICNAVLALPVFAQDV